MCRCVCVCVHALSCVQLFATPWTVDRQTPLSMEFSRQEYWSGLPFPSAGDLPKQVTETASLALQAVFCISGRFFTTEPPGKPTYIDIHIQTDTEVDINI